MGLSIEDYVTGGGGPGGSNRPAVPAGVVSEADGRLVRECDAWRDLAIARGRMLAAELLDWDPEHHCCQMASDACARLEALGFDPFTGGRK